MTLSLLRADDADKQRALLGLLATPVVTPVSDPSLYMLVHRHAATLERWLRRLGYRLAHLDQCYRLRRTPAAGTVAVPVGPVPERGLLLLTLYAAACLDDHHADSITLQELSDVVRLSAAGRGGWPYDPEQRQHRYLFVEAVRGLTGHGVLEPLTDAALREGWERSGAGIGAGYRIHRDALVLCIDAGDVDLALAPVEDGEDDRGIRLLRRLVETQALYPAELDDDERAYLRGQRSRLVAMAEEMTGGVVEEREDLLLLSIAPDRDLPDALLLGFPAASARDWACLAVIDRLAATTSGSFRRVSREDVDEIGRAVHAGSGPRLTTELRESPEVVVRVVEQRLVELGLLRLEPDHWVLTPLAGRYRDADLVGPEDPTVPAAEQSTLWEDG